MIAMQTPSITLDSLPWVTRSKERGKPICVAVVGDTILDEYLIGDVTRISPEAPVPVHLVRKSFQSAGGAANVARNIKLAGAEVALFSVVGNDESARQLKAILETDGISTKNLLQIDGRTTIKKTRVTSGNQQLLRIDWERVQPVGEEHQEELLRRLKAAEFDALLVSDYAKGALPIKFLSNLLEIARSRNIPSIVDPKGKDFTRYLHATVITPNRKEACEALGLDPADKTSGDVLAKKLQETYGLRNVIVTLGAEGMLFVPESVGGKRGNSLYFPAKAREVYDVSGAGDTAAAMIALSLASGSTFEESMYLATLASGRVVEKWGTQPVTRADIESALQESKRESARSASSVGKVMARSDAQREIATLKRRGKRVVFTNGCFDILHAGHVSYLEEAKARGDILIIGLNSDGSIKRIKGPKRPVNPLEQRAKVLAALGMVDMVVPFEEDTPLELIKALVPDVLVKGADWKPADIVGSDVVLAAGGSVETIALVPGVSTTAIIDKASR